MYKRLVNLIKSNKSFTILLVVFILWHFFIFGHSLMPGEISSNQSGAVVDVVKPVVDVVAPNLAKETLNLIVRKAAHLSEFAVLGGLLFLIYNKFFKKWELIIRALIHGLIVASIDETIQLFIPNRAGLITDVLIDFTGVLIGFFISFYVYKLIKRRKNNKIVSF